MYLGMTEEEVIKDIPVSPKGTKNKRVIEYLQEHGVDCDTRWTPVRGKTLPEIAFVRIRYTKTECHLVLKVGETWYDPSFNAPLPGYNRGNRLDYGNGGIISFLAVRP